MPDSPGLDTNSNMLTMHRNPPHRLHERRHGGDTIEPVTGMPGTGGPVIRSTRIRAPVPPQASPRSPLCRSYEYFRSTGVMRGKCGAEARHPVGPGMDLHPVRESATARDS